MGSNTGVAAAQEGHLDVLQWLCAQDPPCPWDPLMCLEHQPHVAQWVRGHFSVHRAALAERLRLVAHGVRGLRGAARLVRCPPAYAQRAPGRLVRETHEGVGAQAREEEKRAVAAAKEVARAAAWAEAETEAAEAEEEEEETAEEVWVEGAETTEEEKMATGEEIKAAAETEAEAKEEEKRAVAPRAVAKAVAARAAA